MYVQYIEQKTTAKRQTVLDVPVPEQYPKMLPSRHTVPSFLLQTTFKGTVAWDGFLQFCFITNKYFEFFCIIQNLLRLGKRFHFISVHMYAKRMKKNFRCE